MSLVCLKLCAVCTYGLAIFCVQENFFEFCIQVWYALYFTKKEKGGGAEGKKGLAGSF